MSGITGMGWDPRVPRVTARDAGLTDVLKLLGGLHVVSPRLVANAMEDTGDDGLLKGDDDTELIRWTLLIAHDLGVAVYLDDVYLVSGVLELQEGQTLYGRGPHRQGLRHNVKSLGDGTYKQTMTSLTTAPGVRTCTIRDLQIDGAQSEVDWDKADADISNLLRNSPAFSGISFTNQSRRSVPEKVYLDRVNVHDTCGSCLLSFTRLQASSLTLGNSVSGRVLYGARGRINGLETWGFTRTSIARVNGPCVISDWSYRGRGQKNPWPQNANQDNVAAAERRGDGGMVVLDGIDWDLTDSELRSGLHVMEHTRVTGRMRGCSSSLYSSPKQSGPLTVAADIVAEDCPPPRFHQHANLTDCRIRWANRTSRNLEDYDWSYTTAAYPIWTRQLYDSLQISLKRQPHHAENHRQNIEIHIDEPWPQWLVLHFVDLAERVDGVWRLSEIVPTRVVISGRVNNKLAAIFGIAKGTTEQPRLEAEDIERLPLEIVLNGLAYNRVEPGPFRGDSLTQFRFESS